jgi:hypothetical protein
MTDGRAEASFSLQPRPSQRENLDLLPGGEAEAAEILNEYHARRRR